jgi:LysM repeat protein
VPPASAETENKPAQTAGTANQTVNEKPRTATAEIENARHTELKPSHPPLVKEEAVKRVSSSGKTYVVKKGDNPVVIAKKLKVSYSDLIALNHIEDARKLHIGQKLLVPETANSKTTSAKTTNRKKDK